MCSMTLRRMFAIEHRRRRRTHRATVRVSLACVALTALAIILTTSPAAAQAPPGQAASAGSAAPQAAGPQPSSEATSERADTCMLGVYILALYDINYPGNEFTADFWMWFTYRDSSLEPLKTVEVTNAKSYTFANGSTETKRGIHWAAQKCKATLRENWDTRDFPFDHQTLRIVIEDADNDTASLVYVPDTAHSRIDSRVVLDGWNISGLRFVREDARYNTNYGDPELAESSTYPSLVVYVDLVRDGLGLFFKLFTGVYVAFSLCMMVFFFDEHEIGSRFSVLVGAMFAAVANKYIVDSFLPMSVGFTLVDRIHVVTFVYILLSGCVSVFVMHYQKKTGAEEKHGDYVAGKVDRYAFWILLTTYLGINAYYLIRAT